MPISAKDRYFGPGLGSYGEDCPHEAFDKHRQHVRVERLNDLIGKDEKLSATQISRKFDDLASAIKAADASVVADNAEFMKKHGIKA